MLQNKLEPAGNNERRLMDTIIEFQIETNRSSSESRKQKQTNQSNRIDFANEALNKTKKNQQPSAHYILIRHEIGTGAV